ncbi:MAG TPA: hypothetical protein VGH80_11940 [Xanthomonadaceae bacterium]
MFVEDGAGGGWAGACAVVVGVPLLQPASSALQNSPWAMVREIFMRLPCRWAWLDASRISRRAVSRRDKTSDEFAERGFRKTGWLAARSRLCMIVDH